MSRFISVLFAVLLAFGSTAAMAETISYNNITATYAGTLVDDGDNSDSGWGLAFSKTLGDTLYLTGSFERNNFTGADVDTYRLGLGARVNLTESTDLYGEATAIRAGIDYDNPQLDNFDSYGYGVEVGFRHALARNFEVRAGVAAERLTAVSSWEKYAVVGATLKVFDNIALVADGRLNGDVREYRVGAQFQF